MANDIIDRQEALKTFPAKCPSKYNMDYAIGYNKCRDTIFEQIKSLPQAEPEHARWIENEEESSESKSARWSCSKCNSYGNPMMKYCSDCGSKMDNTVPHNKLQLAMSAAAKVTAEVAENLSEAFSIVSKTLNGVDMNEVFREFAEKYLDNY